MNSDDHFIAFQQSIMYTLWMYMYYSYFSSFTKTCPVDVVMCRTETWIGFSWLFQPEQVNHSVWSTLYIEMNLYWLQEMLLWIMMRYKWEPSSAEDRYWSTLLNSLRHIYVHNGARLWPYVTQTTYKGVDSHISNVSEAFSDPLLRANGPKSMTTSSGLLPGCQTPKSQSKWAVIRLERAIDSKRLHPTLQDQKDTLLMSGC